MWTNHERVKLNPSNHILWSLCPNFCTLIKKCKRESWPGFCNTCSEQRGWETRKPCNTLHHVVSGWTQTSHIITAIANVSQRGRTHFYTDIGEQFPYTTLKWLQNHQWRKNHRLVTLVWGRYPKFASTLPLQILHTSIYRRLRKSWTSWYMIPHSDKFLQAP